jgi:hypothetical protein
MGVTKPFIPDGTPRSGRVWKIKQKSRSSAQLRAGILANQTKSEEERRELKNKRLKILQLERAMKEETKQKIEAEKLRRAEKKKRSMELDYKNTVYQQVSTLGLGFDLHSGPRLTQKN